MIKQILVVVVLVSLFVSGGTLSALAIDDSMPMSVTVTPRSPEYGEIQRATEIWRYLPYSVIDNDPLGTLYYGDVILVLDVMQDQTQDPDWWIKGQIIECHDSDAVGWYVYVNSADVRVSQTYPGYE